MSMYTAARQPVVRRRPGGPGHSRAGPRIRGWHHPIVLNSRIRIHPNSKHQATT
jgi:hypothetical protein